MRGNDDAADAGDHPGPGYGVEAMVEPAKPDSHGPPPGRLLPQERAVAEVDLRQVAERQVALDHLDQVEGLSNWTANTMKSLS